MVTPESHPTRTRTKTVKAPTSLRPRVTTSSSNKPAWRVGRTHSSPFMGKSAARRRDGAVPSQMQKGGNPVGRPLVHVDREINPNRAQFLAKTKQPEREQGRLPGRPAASASPAGVPPPKAWGAREGSGGFLSCFTRPLGSRGRSDSPLGP